MYEKVFCENVRTSKFYLLSKNIIIDNRILKTLINKSRRAFQDYCPHILSFR